MVYWTIATFGLGPTFGAAINMWNKGCQALPIYTTRHDQTIMGLAYCDTALAIMQSVRTAMTVWPGGYLCM